MFNLVKDMTDAIGKPPRILSIDIMRGVTLFLMLFVNDLYSIGVPKWLLHTKASQDAMGLADWVFPGFLFMVGMSIPHALASKRKLGDGTLKIFLHIMIRTLSLLLIGVLLMNAGSINEDLTGMDRNLWAVLLYVSIFLVWNHYPEDQGKKYLYLGMRLAGILGIVYLASIFKAGDAQNPKWIEIGWWGILGLIGWGYFVAATACLILKSRLSLVVGLWLLFIMINIASQLGMKDSLNFLKPVFGVIISGNVPSIVLAGLSISLILSLKSYDRNNILFIVVGVGIVCLCTGFFLRNWFIISKIYATPSWALICNGISILVYAILFFIVDIRFKSGWAGMFQIAGRNSLTTYLAPDVIYFICWGMGYSIFIYKQDTNAFLTVTGSLIWAALMIGIAWMLSKIRIRLKL